MPLGKKPTKATEKRDKVVQDLFQLQKCVESGFPSKCSALAYDERLKLLAVATKNGYLKIYGQPGVEFVGLHADEKEVQKVMFVPEQARLITLCSDSSLHLWELNFDSSGQGALEEVRSVPLLDADNKPLVVSALCLTRDGRSLFLGTENSFIYILRVSDLSMLQAPLRPDVLLIKLPKRYQTSPGSIESITLNPQNSAQLLIAYAHGLVVSCTIEESDALQADAAYHCDGITIRSLSAHRDGNQLVTAHEDGSYVYWHLHPDEASSDEEDSADENEQVGSVRVLKLKKKPKFVYSPSACKPITKLMVKTSEKDDFLILAGGMPRAAHNDKFTVSVIRGKQHVAFELTSKVIDFIVVDSTDLLMHFDNPDLLFILAEEELVAIDLQSEQWQQTPTPYMGTIHSSAITFSSHLTDVDVNFWSKLRVLGEAHLRRFNQSVRAWPISGGHLLSQDLAYCARDLFVTGHESGAVNFWDASSTGSIRWLCKLSTAKLFSGEFADAIDAAYIEEVEPGEPPFRKVGLYDPYSDDPRLAVQKVVVCSGQQAVAVAGAAGQAVVFHLADQDRENVLPLTPRDIIKIEIVKADEKFIWKGWESLPIRDSAVNLPAGFQPVALVEVSPPAAICALDFSAAWNVLVVGTAHGYTIVDVAQRRAALTRCTLNLASELARQAAQAGPMQRVRSSLKKSLRQSFRRVRRARDSVRRSMRKKNAAPPEKKGGRLAQAAGKEKVLRGQAAVAETKPVERAVEAHVDQKEVNMGLVRTALLAETYVSSSQNRVPTAIIGTNGGVALIHTITLPANRATESAKCDLSKELQLQHKASIVQMFVLREPDMSPVGANGPAPSSGHHLLVFSEEQIKLFSLPHLKAKCKAKLTAVDGQLIRKAAISMFRTRHGAAQDLTENDAVVLTNLGELRVYHVDAHTIRCDMQAACIKQQDAVGINNCALTRNAQGYYHSSPSEFMRFSVSLRNVQAPRCGVALAESNRALKQLGHPVSNVLPTLSPAAPTTPQFVTLTPKQHTPANAAPQTQQRNTSTSVLTVQTTPKAHNAPVTSTPLSPKPKNAEDPTAVYYSMPPSGPDNTAVYYSMPPTGPDNNAVYYSMPPNLPPKTRSSVNPPVAPTQTATKPRGHDEEEEEEEEDDESESGAEADLQTPPAKGNPALGSHAISNGTHDEDEDEEEEEDDV